MATPSDVCAECGHTRYNHDPRTGCRIDDNYRVPSCPCLTFQGDKRTCWPARADHERNIIKDAGPMNNVVAAAIAVASDPKRHPFKTNGFPVEACLACGYAEPEHRQGRAMRDMNLSDDEVVVTINVAAPTESEYRWSKDEARKIRDVLNGLTNAELL